MPPQLSISLAGSHRQWLILRPSTNPITVTGGPLTRISLPLEARVTEQDIEIQILRLAFDLKLGLLRYRHSYHQGDARAQGLGEPGRWHTESIGEFGVNELDMQVARSDWYELVVAKLGIGSYLITPLYLPAGVPTWQVALTHLDNAGRAVAQGDPPAVFWYCRAAIDALPGAKTDIFAAMPEGKKRDAINDLTKRIGEYVHSGRHVTPNSGGQKGWRVPHRPT
jgi:hypothetical protein